MSKGKILGIDRQQATHFCNKPFIMFRRTGTVWQCHDCDQKYRIEFVYWPGDTYRDWVPYEGEL